MTPENDPLLDHLVRAHILERLCADYLQAPPAAVATILTESEQTAVLLYGRREAPYKTEELARMHLDSRFGAIHKP